MTVRPPADAVVALRSLPRRFRSLFAGLGDDESPDDLAQRVGSDGQAALDHLVAASRTVAFLGRALEQLLVEADPVLHPAVTDAAARTWEAEPGGTVDDRLAELEAAAEALADRAQRAPAGDWGRAARVADRDAAVTASAVLWDAVDSAVTHLKAAERTLAEVRRRR